MSNAVSAAAGCAAFPTEKFLFNSFADTKRELANFISEGGFWKILHRKLARTT
jgi:hypothetical protein